MDLEALVHDAQNEIVSRREHEQDNKAFNQQFDVEVVRLAQIRGELVERLDQLDTFFSDVYRRYARGPRNDPDSCRIRLCIVGDPNNEAPGDLDSSIAGSVEVAIVPFSFHADNRSAARPQPINRTRIGYKLSFMFIPFKPDSNQPDEANKVDMSEERTTLNDSDKERFSSLFSKWGDVDYVRGIPEYLERLTDSIEDEIIIWKEYKKEYLAERSRQITELWRSSCHISAALANPALNPWLKDIEALRQRGAQSTIAFAMQPPQSTRRFRLTRRSSIETRPSD